MQLIELANTDERSYTRYRLSRFNHCMEVLLKRSIIYKSFVSGHTTKILKANATFFKRTYVSFFN